MAILAARAFDIPFFFNPSYCFSFLTPGRLLGITTSFPLGGFLTHNSRGPNPDPEARGVSAGGSGGLEGPGEGVVRGLVEEHEAHVLNVGICVPDRIDGNTGSAINRVAVNAG